MRAAPRAARPRWLIASFSSGASSAIVRSAVDGRRGRTRGRSRSRRRRAARRRACRCSGPRRAARSPSRVDVGERADVGAAALPAGASAQQLGEVLLVGRVLAGEARRAHAGRAAERRGLDARVVGDRRARRSPRAAARALIERVLGERRRRSRAAARRRRAAARPRAAPAARANSRTLCALRVARTSLTAAGAAMRRAPATRAQLARCPLRGEREQLVEVRARQRRALGGRLDLDEPALAGHDDVRVDLGGRVLGVVEVEQRHAADDPARHRRDRAGQRRALELALGDRARAQRERRARRRRR